MEEQEVLIKVENLSKKFCKDLKTGLKYGLQDLFANVFGNNKSDMLRPKEFWAVKDINFELRRGECLGLIGHNGAGKSTLLKMLNGLIRPDVGSITMKGRVGALIELGAGFNNILTGRENIYNNGAVLGFTREEIDTKLTQIIEFAELEEFIDMPVQHYSSGMKVRLGFAVAAQMEPDILIIDEVLAVGDLGFVLKCFKTIDNILPNTAIVFVSHSMPMVSRICTHVLLMERGADAFQGTNVSKAIDLYYQRFTNNEQNIIFDDNTIALTRAELLGVNSQNEQPQIQWKGKFKLRLVFELKKEQDIPSFHISIYDKEQRPVAMLEPNKIQDGLKIKDNKIQFCMEHEQLMLSKGIYSVNISVVKPNSREPLLRVNGVLNFQVIHEEEIWPPFYLETTLTDLN